MLARRVSLPSLNQTPRVGEVEAFRDCRPSQESTAVAVAATAAAAAFSPVGNSASVAFLEFHPTRPTLLTVKDVANGHPSALKRVCEKQ